MHYLVTGGAGFIGSNIVKELLSKNEKVTILDNFSTGRRDNIVPFMQDDNFTLIEGDLRSFHIVRQAVKGVDYILHQGALPSVPRSINDPITSNDVNVLGTLNVLEAAKESGVKRVIYASSSSVYGNSEILPKVEDMPINPLSPYAISKYTAEKYCQIYTQLYNLETVCLRYFNVFGPNQDPNSQYSAVIPKFIKMINNNEKPVIHGDGLQSRDFTFVGNNVYANIQACTAENAIGKVFNIACGERYTLLQLVEEINKLLDKNIVPEFTSNRPGDVEHSMADITRAKQYLKYKVIHNFINGLKSTVKYLLDT